MLIGSDSLMTFPHAGVGERGATADRHPHRPRKKQKSAISAARRRDLLSRRTFWRRERGPGTMCAPARRWCLIVGGAAMADFPTITHAALTVRDLNRSIPWYPSLFGTEPVLDEHTGPFRPVVWPFGQPPSA